MQEAYRHIHQVEKAEDITRWMLDAKEAQRERREIEAAMIDTNYQELRSN